MKRNLYRLLVSICVLGTIALLIYLDRAGKRSVTYQVEEVPLESPIPNTYLKPFVSSMNDRGEIAGTLAKPGMAVAFAWSPEEGVVYFPRRDGVMSDARDINNQGVVTGSFRNPGEPLRSFAWAALPSASESVAIGFPGTAGKGINDSGQVIGAYESPANVHHAFVWSASEGMTTAPIPDNARVDQAHLMDSGAGVVIAENNKMYAWRAGDAPVLLAAVGGQNQQTGLNRTGVLAATRRSPDPYLLERFDLYRAFILNASGEVQDLDTAGATSTQANDINDVGHVVGSRLTIGTVRQRGLESLGYVDAVFGTSLQGESYYHTRPTAALWVDGLAVDLNQMIPADSGWELIEAAAVNNLGQIVGRGWLDGRSAIFLLSPIQGDE